MCVVKYLNCIIKSLYFVKYFRWIQNSLVQAEYWHDPIKESDYIKGSHFLADINNERFINKSYRENLLKLKNFIMVMFTNDTMVIPKESEWFAFYSPGQDKEIMPLEQSVSYLTVSNYIENQKLILIIRNPVGSSCTISVS